MREELRYIADDGSVFEDESDCREYEFQQNTKNGKWTLLDCNKNILDNTNPRSYEECSFVYLPNSHAARELTEAWDEDTIGCYLPDFLNDWSVDTGLWAFDDSCDEWYHVGNRIAEYQDLADEVMEVINNN